MVFDLIWHFIKSHKRFLSCNFTSLTIILSSFLSIFEHLKHNIEAAAPGFMILPALKQMEKIPKIVTKFGPCAKGSVIATQQQLQVEYVVNIYDGVQYPALP